jgi:outer membrane protein TolC
VRARSEVREAYSAYRSSYDIARHYRDEVVPLRKRISDEVLLRYNGMLASVFELLADARDQVGSVNAAIDAQRDFWIAETSLQSAVKGTGAGAGGVAEPRGQAAVQAPARAH